MDQSLLKNGEDMLKPLELRLDNSMIALHHVTPSSSKTPLLFTGHLQTPLSVGPFNDPKELLSDIRLLTSFPGETLLFPKVAKFDQNMQLMSKLEPSNREYLTNLKNLGEQAGVLGVGIDLQVEISANAWLRLESVKKLVLGDDKPTQDKEMELVVKKLRRVEEIIKKEGYWGKDWKCMSL